MILFPEPAVPREEPMRGSEPKVNFFLESTRDIAVLSRATINDWYTRFPDADGSFRESSAALMTSTTRRLLMSCSCMSGITINFEFFPRRAEPGAEGDRIVGMGPPIGGWVNSGERLRVALNGKAGSRYDLRAKPFAPVVAVHDSFCSLDQVMDALYGSEQLVIATHELTRAGNGFFGRSSANLGKNRRVSCVFVIQGWLPCAPEDATIYRLDNPFADGQAFP
ncbi:hypothetical protein [Micromonospora sp. NPDC005806]|uniref:hypothetical protein n=1 Tax=Micromonospora sp. NPDC005806 TaxID=3364234 RepID=UPI0036B3F2E0